MNTGHYLKSRRCWQGVFLFLLLTQFSIGFAQAFDSSVYFFRLDGGMLRQSDEGLAYTIDSPAMGVFYDPAHGPLVRIRPSYKLSGGGAFGFVTANGTDTVLSFFFNQHSKSDEEALSPPEVQTLLTLLIPPPWDVREAEGASSAYFYRNNRYNLTLGHWFPGRFSWHPYFGVEVADIKAKQDTYYTNVDPDGMGFASGENARIIENSSIVGIGPLAGIDTLYELFNHISFMGKIEFALLAGKMRSSYYALPIVLAQDEGLIQDKRDTTLFKMMHAQLGVSYHVKTTGKMSANVTLGYQVTEYLNAIAVHAFIDDYNSFASSNLFEDSGSMGPFLSVQINFLS